MPVDGSGVTLNVAPACSAPALSRFSHDNVPSLLWKSDSSELPVSSVSSVPTDASRFDSVTISSLVTSSSLANPVGAAVSSIM